MAERIRAEEQQTSRAAYLKMGLRAAAVTLGLLVVAPLPAANAARPQRQPRVGVADHTEPLGPVLIAEDQKIGRDIVGKVPVKYEKVILHDHGDIKEDFSVENPLAVTIRTPTALADPVSGEVGPGKVELVGYMLQKGAGVRVNLFAYNAQTMSLTPDTSDPNYKHRDAQVIFPSPEGASWDLVNPVNPVTGIPISNNPGDGEPKIGYEYYDNK